MINNLLSFLTYENIYLIANWGIIPFWLLLIFFPYNQLTNFFTPITSGFSKITLPNSIFELLNFFKSSKL